MDIIQPRPCAHAASGNEVPVDCACGNGDSSCSLLSPSACRAAPSAASDLFATCPARSPCKAQIQITRKSKACSIDRIQGTEVLGGQLRKRSSLRRSLSSGGGPSTFAAQSIMQQETQQRRGEGLGSGERMEGCPSPDTCCDTGATQQRRRRTRTAPREEPDKLSSRGMQ